MSDELRDRIADIMWRTEEKSWEDQAQEIITELNLSVSVHQEHKLGSAVEPGETKEEYDNRVALKRVYRVTGWWRE